MSYIVSAENRDTICAVSTPPGVGGIAVVRISGPKAIAITDSIWRGARIADAATHTAHLGSLVDPADGSVLDQCVATIFRAPGSFTGDDVVELSIHGSKWLQQETVALLIRQGCRLAEPGEFTRRAFLSGKMDLAEAEGVADVIASTSRAAHKVAVNQMRGGLSQELTTLHDQLLELASLLELELDFSEEDVEFASRQQLTQIAQRAYRLTGDLAATFAAGKAIREGVPVALVGETNAGKSTLLNTLSRHERAIVSDIHGTTRDTIEDTIDIQGIPFRLVDTAGLRLTDDPIENLGIQRSLKAIAEASIVVWVIDTSRNDPQHKTTLDEISHDIMANLPADASLIIALNKCDTSADGDSHAPAYLDTKKATQTSGETSGEVLTSYDKSDEALASGETSNHNSSYDQVEQLTKEKDAHITEIRRHITTLLTPRPSHPQTKTITLTLSAKQHRGISTLRQTLVDLSGLDEILSADKIMLTNIRHYQALTATHDALAAVLTGLSTGLSGDFIAQDLRQALHHLGTITGAITTPDILSTIFTRFCIGK